jgi:cytochrome subunit of sulfide dehydrogenase
MRIHIQLAGVLLSGIAATTVLAQDAATLYTRGRATEGSAIPSLVGMPRDYMIMQVKAFKDGSRPATVMHQLSKGFTDQQIETVATYFASLKR